MVKSYYYDKTVNDWLELVQGERGERGEQGPPGNVNIEAGETPFTIDNTVGTRVFIGDTMIHGDTGWQDMSDNLVSPATIIGDGLALIRRINSAVHIKIAGIQLFELSGDNNIFQIPVGFRHSDARQIHYSGSTDTQPETFLLSSSVWFLRYRGASEGLSSNPDYPLNISFISDQQWPTSLPGTPA